MATEATEINIVSGEMEMQPDADRKPFNFQNMLKGGISVAAARDWAQSRRASIRPWAEFANVTRFKTPASVPRLSRRLLTNLAHFQSNYLIVFVALAIFCVLTSPLLLVMLAAVLIGCHYLSQRVQPMSILGRQLTIGQQYALVGVASLPLLVWAGAGGAVFWVLGASCVLVTLHAAFYNVEALLGNDQEFDLVMQEV